MATIIVLLLLGLVALQLPIESYRARRALVIALLVVGIIGLLAGLGLLALPVNIS